MLAVYLSVILQAFIILHIYLYLRYEYILELPFLMDNVQFYSTLFHDRNWHLYMPILKRSMHI